MPKFQGQWKRRQKLSYNNKIKEVKVAVEKIGEKYKCAVCGNEVIVTNVGGGELVCCGQPMQKTEG